MNEQREILDPSRRRRFGWGAMGIALVIGLAVGSGLSLSSWHGHRDGRGGRADGGEPLVAAKRWVCPMHPTVVSDHPGECPICGMKLVPQGPQAQRSAAGAQVAPAEGARKIVGYRSPMDPKQTSPVPRKDEMGMDYLPIYADELDGTQRPQADGLATVDIDPRRQQLIGLRTAAVVRGAVGGSWRTVGRVAVDETRVHHVNVKIAGFADHVYVDYIGKVVKAGAPLFSIYSPDLLSAEEEYLLALRMRRALGEGGGAMRAGDDLVAAARRRLELWDIPAAEIARIAKTGRPQKTLTLYAPAHGVVTRKDVVMGHRLQEGDMPYEITDLSRVWVLADAYESDLVRLKAGQAASLTLQAFPNRAFKGQVIFIDPLLDAKTRTAKVRLEFANPAGELRPEMFGEVTLQAAARRGLRVPVDAIIDSGGKKVVFVASGEGRFQPREVRLGVVGEESAEVLSGVTEGDRVVTRANFLVDSESRLRASLAAMGKD